MGDVRQVTMIRKAKPTNEMEIAMPRQTSLSIEKQQRLYDTLKKIARQYMTPAQIARDAERDGSPLDRREYLEMAYENIQGEAERAIKGLRRPT